MQWPEERRQREDPIEEAHYAVYLKKISSSDNRDPLITFAPSLGDGPDFDVNWTKRSSFHDENETLTSNQNGSGKDSPFSSSSSFCSNTSGVKRSAPSDETGNEELSSDLSDKTEKQTARQVERLLHENENLSGPSLPSLATLCASLETGAQLCVAQKEAASPFGFGPSSTAVSTVDSEVDFTARSQTKEEELMNDVFFAGGYHHLHRLGDVATSSNKLINTHAASSPTSPKSVRAEQMSMNPSKSSEISFLRCILLEKEREMASAALGLHSSSGDHHLLGERANPSFHDPTFFFSTQAANNVSFSRDRMNQDRSVGTENPDLSAGSLSCNSARHAVPSPANDVGDAEWVGWIAQHNNRSFGTCPRATWHSPQRKEEQGDDGTGAGIAQIQLSQALAEKDCQVFVAGITEELGGIAMNQDDNILFGLETFCGDGRLTQEEGAEDTEEGEDQGRDNCEEAPRAVNAGDSNLIAWSDLSQRDVLLGRGGFTIHHKGNKYYRKLVNRRVHSYMNKARKHDKTSLSEEVVRAIVAGGGRFVKKCTSKKETTVTRGSDETEDSASNDGDHPSTMTNKETTDDRCWLVLNLMQARQKVSQRFREEAADLEDAGLHSWKKQKKQKSRKRLRLSCSSTL